MKYYAYCSIFLSLLVWHLCTAAVVPTETADWSNTRNNEATNRKSSDLRNNELPTPATTQLNDHELKQEDFSLSGNDEKAKTGKVILTKSKRILSSDQEVEDYILRKINEIRELLKGHKTETEVKNAIAMDLNELPTFPSTLFIGNLTKKYKLADVNHTNVRVSDLSKLKYKQMLVNLEQRKANITISTDKLTIDGNYTLNNWIKYASGYFCIELKENITYHEEDIFSLHGDKEVDIADAYAAITTGNKQESTYENIGLLTQIFESTIAKELAEDVLSKVSTEIGHRIRHFVSSKIRQAIENNPSKERNRIEEIIKSILSEVRSTIQKTGISSLHLGIDSIQSGFSTKKVLSSMLSGLTSFHVSNVNTRVLRNEFIIEAKMELGPHTFTAQMQEDGDQKRTLEYDIPKLETKVTISKLLHKDTEKDDGKLDITDLYVKVENMKEKSTPRSNANWGQQASNEITQQLKIKIENALYKVFNAMIANFLEYSNYKNQQEQQLAQWSRSAE